MSRKQRLTVIAVLAVFSWSVVMAAIGHVAAVTTLVPSLALAVQQIVQACAGAESRRTAAPSSVVEQDEERAG